ncbi:MAG: C39 family peptidase [Chloroflexota bacterium]
MAQYYDPDRRAREAMERRARRMSSAPRPRSPWLTLFFALILVGGIAASGAVATNAFGAGTKFERLVRKVELAINPPPDRQTVATVEITPEPSIDPTPTPAVSTAPGTTPAPATPAPVRKPVNVRIPGDPRAVFAHEIRVDWCAPAGTQMVLAMHGKGNNSEALQKQIASRVGEWESYSDSHNGEWGPAAIAEALDAYGVPGYQIHAHATREAALRDAAIAISKTGAPVVLLAWRGAHTWIMDGYRANADPRIFRDATVTGAYILDPWYPDTSSIWGRSDPPGTFQDTSEMIRNFLPWKRPEGKYPERDGKFIIIVPTVPLSPIA